MTRKNKVIMMILLTLARILIAFLFILLFLTALFGGDFSIERSHFYWHINILNLTINI